MTLTTRLTLFFVVTLAAVLAGFSISLYAMARAHLYRQVDERLEATLNTLVAAAEIGRAGVEWEPAERSLRFAIPSADGEITWVISDRRGRMLDRAAVSGTEDLVDEAANKLSAGPEASRRLHWHGARWLAGQRWVLPDPNAVVKHVEPDEIRHDALVITAAIPLEGVRASLRWLAMALLGVSALVLAGAAIVGRIVCRRALEPVRRMADAARSMSGDDQTGRLELPRAKDELADLAQSFNGLLDRLGESYGRQKRFTGDASHQLRTPLAVILGQAEVALRRERSADEYRRVLTMVKAKAEHLQRIVHSLLFLARADGEAAINRGRVELADWMRDHVKSWEGHPRYADLHTEISDQAAAATTDPVLLGELVNVLLDNACRFSPAGSPITTSVGIVGEEVAISVDDEGAGIPASELNRVFEPFVGSGNGGVGLGLSIANRLAGALEGKLDVRSVEGKGSRFTLRLPIRRT